MGRSLDLAYLAVAVAASPFWLLRMMRKGTLRTDWAGRFGHAPRLPQPAVRRLLVHAVSVGEVNAVRLLIERLSASSLTSELVVSATTDTGVRRARSLFQDSPPAGGRETGLTVVRYPLDFSCAVGRFLDAVQPDVVALTELEVWPNFLAACETRGIAVCIINGRLTRRSMRRYRFVRPMLRRSFQRLAFIAAQNGTYAERFRQLGVDPRRIHITGTMKWDTAQIADDVPGADELAASMGIDRNRRLVVAGSTAPGEHELLHGAVPQDAQLLCAPRRPEWFDQAARALPGCARRSRGDHGSATGRFLLDTIGELRQAYALADVVVIGRSFTHLHGSDMMEPVALGKATIVGPAVSDFEDTAAALLNGDGLVQTDRDHLATELRRLLDDAARREELAANGRAVIRANLGATDRHAKLLCSLLGRTASTSPTPEQISPFQHEAKTAKEEKEERAL
jgi:3-deoxy-D-manno-octulosonic-acid transferase